MSVPLILLMRDAGILVALAALCIYPLVEVPRVLARPSWWRGAMVSALVWLVVFVGLMATVDSVRRMREDAMVFLLPFTMYPLVLAISGLVRLEGNLRRRPRESGPRIAAILGAVACGLLVGVPVASNMIPVITEKITGDTPRNTVYSGEGEVLMAVPGQVSVRMGGARTESFRIGPETKFDFRGPGWRQQDTAPGPAWLKPGQRVNVEYVYRRREAQAQQVNIWMERKGCAGEAKWVAASGTPSPPPEIPSLAGTTWDGWVGPRDAAGPHESMTFRFLEGNRLAYGDGGNPRYTEGAWRQNGAAVIIEVNDCYAEYEGRIEGDEIKGQFSNEVGVREPWTARRSRGSASAATPNQ